MSVIRVWYSNGVVQDYPDLKAAEEEIAEIIEFDHLPLALVKECNPEPDGKCYRCKITVELEQVG